MAKIAAIASRKSNLDKIRKHFQENRDDSGINWLSIKPAGRGEDSKVTIRVLPPWSKRAEGFFYWTESQHFGFSIGGRNRALTCPESINKGKCPICLFLSRLQNSGDPANDKLAGRLRANRRYFVNVIDREDPDKIKIFGSNKKFIEAVLDASDDPDVGDITDPRTGHDITIVRRGAGLKTRYSYRVRAKTSVVTFNNKELYQLDKVVSNLLDHNSMVEVLKSNFTEELKEVGLKFKTSKKSKPVEDEDNESDDDDSGDKEEDTEDAEESEEDAEEEEDEESDEEEDNDSDDDDETEEDSDEEDEE